MSSRGFTLIEVMVATCIFLILIFAVTDLLISAIQNPKFELNTTNTIDQARFLASKFTNELRAAAYGSYPLAEATDSEIIFYSPIGATAGNINRIRYYLSNGVLYKGVITPINGVYDTSRETIATVLSGISNGSTPLFYYYDDNYDSVSNTTPLSNPVNITQVRFVKMNLTLQYQLTKQKTSTFSLNAGSAIRILKDNLAN
jgi:prepilin-type N-terminal cleavage/methylation domain-containing protein